MHANVVDGQDVGVVERACSTRFLLKPSQPVGISREGVGQDFDSDFAAQARVTGPIHLAHATRTQGRDDFIRPEFSAGRKPHLCA